MLPCLLECFHRLLVAHHPSVIADGWNQDFFPIYLNANRANRADRSIFVLHDGPIVEIDIASLNHPCLLLRGCLRSKQVAHAFVAQELFLPQLTLVFDCHALLNHRFRVRVDLVDLVGVLEVSACEIEC